jgi:methylmalonyl-CoA mutase N-terminal domain/subunit
MPKDIFQLSGYNRAKAINKAYRIVLNALDEQLNTYLSFLTLTGSTSEQLIEETVSEDVTKQMLVDIYSFTMPLYAKRTFDAINKGKVKLDWSQTWFNEFLATHIAVETAENVTNVSNYTKWLIRNRLSDGVKKGLSIPNLAKEIKSEMAGINRRRAMTIARTEVISSSNKASLEGAKQTGANVFKKWIPAKQMRTRGAKPKDKFDHFHMDKHEPIPLTELFNVSGESLEYPGDATHGASGGNTINCRCAIGYVRAK